MENRELNQAAFDKVVRHLLRQGEKSLAASDAITDQECRYRSPTGLMCAIGCLIPDDEYDRRLEGWGASSWRINTLPSLSGLDQGLLRDLQNVHDHRGPEDWLNNLRIVAEDYGPTMPDLEPSP